MTDAEFVAALARVATASARGAVMRCRHGDVVNDHAPISDVRFRLRIEAQAAMAAALGYLDALGDELPAAATLQHAIDRLSYQGVTGEAETVIALCAQLRVPT